MQGIDEQLPMHYVTSRNKTRIKLKYYRNKLLLMKISENAGKDISINYTNNKEIGTGSVSIPNRDTTH